MNAKMAVRVKVQPKAARSEVVGFRESVLQVRVAAVPEKGKANDTLVALLSDRFEVAKKDIQIVSGHTSRNKLVIVGGLSISDLRGRLTEGGVYEL